MTSRGASSNKSGEGIDRAPGMRRGGNAEVDRDGVWVVQGLVQKRLKWLFREQSIEDYGVDAHAEIVAEDDLVTGRMIGLQIKSGNSHFARETSRGWEFRSDSSHLAYWLGHSLPIIVVIVDSSEKAYWEVVSTETITETKKGFRVTIPRNQPFDQSARTRLLELAGRSVGLLDAIPRYYSLLPPDAVRPLRRAEKIDRLATARLAERLSSGRATPGMTAASVIAAQPSWLLASAAVQDLWMAVSGFATEHKHDREAARGYELAADSPGPQSARARAFAGLALFFIDREKAGIHLRRAHDEGQALLADVGLPYLEVPEGDARIVDVPQSMRDASDAELGTEPTVLNFLGEMALRRGDLNAAVSYRERAVESGGESGSAMRLELARTIWRRTAAEGSRSPRERRRAISHAQAAIEERRRWDGPSSEALAVLLDILTTSADVREALRAALPASQGGTARDAEAMDEDVARRGGLAALMADNKQALEFFKQTLPEGPHLHELQALEKDTEDLSTEERIEIWTRLLDEASDDAMATRSISRLVSLGVWPPQVDSLLDRHIIPTDTALMFKALWRAKSGELYLGIAELRDLATRTSTAALALVELLEKDLDPETAIRECERQVDRWGDPALIMLLADLSRRHGYPDRAAEVIKASIANEALASDVRLDMCKWYVARKLTNREYTDAISVARQGLAIGDDPDLAWHLIAALYNDGKVTQARDALARHKPAPTSEVETRLWMQLHLGTPVSVDDAHIMVDLAGRQPNGDLRNAIISHVVREVLHAPQQTDRAYPAAIVDTVRQLAEETGPESLGGLRLVDADDETLREILVREQVDPVKAQKLTNDIRRGIASHADLASMTQRPYGAVLLQRPGGVLFTTDITPGLRRAGERAASLALESPRCVIDLSSLHLLNLIPSQERIRLRTAIPELVVALAAVTDTVNTRGTMRGLAIATFTASLQADGTIKRTTLSPTEQALLREQAEALETSASSLRAERVDTPNPTAAEETIALAQQHGIPLWCDDTALRQKARAHSIPTFGLLDLTTVLANSSTTLDQTKIRRQLAEHYVVDLPLTADDIITVATTHDWAPGPAHTALSRPAWWQHHSDWTTPWLQIATAARNHSPTALTDITQAAIAGAIKQVTSGFRTQRYQQLVVLALVACHQTELTPPPDMLDTLAQHVHADLPPQPNFVLTALIDELERQSVTDATSVAHRLLPHINLT